MYSNIFRSHSIKSFCIARIATLVFALGCFLSPYAHPQENSSPPDNQDSSSSEPVLLRFLYNKGQQFKVLSIVDEDVSVNGKLAGHARILNKITYKVVDVAENGEWGLLKGSFETSEQHNNKPGYVISKSYDSEFKRDSLGAYTIGPSMFMPVVRNVPTFPDKAVAPGDRWSAAAEEVQDFSSGRGLMVPFKFQYEARYQYQGTTTRDGVKVHVITVDCPVDVTPYVPELTSYPSRIEGISRQKIYWNAELGSPVGYEESFNFTYLWTDGTRYDYRGTASSNVTEVSGMDKKAVQKQVQDQVANLPNVSVESSDKGVVIRLENLLFEGDSAYLRPSEKAKIEHIAAVLSKYPDRDILVEGHSAKAGWAEGRQKLSEQRAQAVADILIASKVRALENIRIAGLGDTQPIADNSTEAGRAKNRRVEITLEDF